MSYLDFVVFDDGGIQLVLLGPVPNSVAAPHFPLQMALAKTAPIEVKIEDGPTDHSTARRSSGT